jgi:two-component system response regulator AtoC
MPHALIVDDDASTRDALAAIVASEGFTTSIARDLREGIVQIGRHQPDVVLSDLKLPDGSGLNLLREIDIKSGVEMILMTGHASVDSAVDALRLGVADYLVKPINTQRLKAILARVPRTQDLRAEISDLRGALLEFGRFGSMLGRSPAMHRLYDEIVRVAPTEATVFLVGESGTGKELAAQTVHELSLRRKQAFVPVNCGAISPTLIESEMFGHERGSFSGAERQHKGYFERATGGTLFLDEITEMPLDLQTKLLRILETGMLLRVGASRETATDVRVIAATNRDPREAVARGRLREDLFHRLNVFPIQLPPLRARDADAQLLAQTFLDGLNADTRARKMFAPEVLLQMLAYEWPGNVRELKNYVQRSFILADGPVVNAPIAAMALGLHSPLAETVSIPIGMSLADADKRLIFATLKHVGNVKKRAAEVLGISSKTLYNRLIEYGAADASEAAADGVMDANGVAALPGDGRTSYDGIKRAGL